MSKDDIDKAVREAEQYAAEDKKRREEIDTRNNADQLCYQSEKALTDLGDKIDPAEKAAVQEKIDALKEALKGTDMEAIKAKQEELQNKFYEISAKVYEAAQAAQAAQAGADQGAAPNDGVVDADYQEVDENK